AFQNGYFAALANRVGSEDCLDFAGESYVVGPDGRILAQSPAGEDHILYCDVDLSEIENSNARKFFLPSRLPDIYPDL
ncbi:MAG: carbon-nitrogen hydrolase family protein, partial [Candidatus Krumholzibacteria bacterium]|nr:carbon-nitrogen hydrolase family protein [Candidatus Krumholzibacteria bacterium]